MGTVRFLWLEARLSWPRGLWLLAALLWLLRTAGWLPTPPSLKVFGEVALPLVGLLLVQRRWLQEQLRGAAALVPSTPFPQPVLWGLRLGLIAGGLSVLGLALTGLEDYAIWGIPALGLSGVSWLLTVVRGESAGVGLGLGWWGWSVWLTLQLELTRFGGQCRAWYSKRRS